MATTFWKEVKGWLTGLSTEIAMVYYEVLKLRARICVSSLRYIIHIATLMERPVLGNKCRGSRADAVWKRRDSETSRLPVLVPADVALG